LKVTRGFKAPAYALQTVEQGRRAFEAERGSRPFADLVIVIAALNEAENLPEVLGEIPGVVSGVDADVLVVDDGSDDSTAEVARRHGAAVLRLERNCGHGVALRAGYRTAWEHGARYIATLDADGQWDPADLPAMVHLVATDQADLVIGSRALGDTEDTDSFRTLGVRVFSCLARALTGATVTDTSSGLRVMTPDLLKSVPQTQPQYQTSELLIGAAVAGYRIAEVPTVMRQRLSGTSKKGRNLAYGLRYARVMISTWWRESRRHGIRQSRPAFGTRMIRYTIGSAFCLAVSELTLLILLLGGLSGWTASLLASAAGIIPGYPLNRAWTFGRRGRSHTWREVLPYWLTAIGGSLFAALLVGLADPWAKHASQSALTATVISLFVYLGAYGTLWLLKFAYLDRMLFRQVPAEEHPTAAAGAFVRSMDRDSVLAGVTSETPTVDAHVGAFGSELNGRGTLAASQLGKEWE
jgi:putative flippase GtrA